MYKLSLAPTLPHPPTGGNNGGASDSDAGESADGEDAASATGSRKRRRGHQQQQAELNSGGGSLDGSGGGSGGLDRMDWFRLEKSLMAFGYGRWREIAARLRQQQQPPPQQTVTSAESSTASAEATVARLSRAVLAHCLRHYTGDARIRAFVGRLLASSGGGGYSGEHGVSNGDQQRSDSCSAASPASTSGAAAEASLLRHSGLSAPLARGRKTRRLDSSGNWLATPMPPSLSSSSSMPAAASASDDLQEQQPPAVATTPASPSVAADASCGGGGGDAAASATVADGVVIDCPSFLAHLEKAGNKLLHRIRLLYFLQWHIIGDQVRARVLFVCF